MSSDKPYNGWANYATWRVNLEFFDGCGGLDIRRLSTHHVANLLKEQVIEFVTESCDNETVQGWALAFTNQCDFQEIAEHLVYDTNNESDGNNEFE